MAEHLRNDHSIPSNQQQLSIMVAMSERPIDDDEILACPLCPDELYLSKLQNHIAEHLETISLFVLPIVEDEDEDADSDKVAGTGSKSNRDETGTQATLSSLGFSQTDEKDGTQQDFSQLLSMEEATGEVKCETWGAGEATSAVLQNLSTDITSTNSEYAIALDLAPLQQQFTNQISEARKTKNTARTEQTLKALNFWIAPAWLRLIRTLHHHI
jgi:hypothetical protein